ncbi:hypothetical protein QTP38_31065, partial [Klebsiella oxytoca]|uniref:hypothetical protein n=1 Tax=Klebsiella oxytoca TaxID=571 RepID=UPI002594BF7D
MGSCAAPSAKGDDKFITTDYLQQCPTMLNTRVHQSEVSMATEALLQRLAAVRGRLSLCADQAAAAK